MDGETSDVSLIMDGETGNVLDGITTAFCTDVEEHLRPSDVLDYMDTLKEVDIDRIKDLQNNGRRSDASYHLIECLLNHENSQECVEKFIYALREEGYDRLVESFERVEENKERIKQEHLEFLTRMVRSDLVKEIDVGPMIPIMVSKGHLKQRDQQDLNSMYKMSRQDACSELLTRLKRKNRNWAMILFDTLKETQPIVISKADPGATTEELQQKGVIPANNDIEDSQATSEEEFNSDTEKFDDEESEKAQKKRKRPELKLRLYQLELAEKSVAGHNAIICAQTGTGKTWVALYITQQHLLNTKPARVVFLARTNALVEQQHRLFQKYLRDHKVYHLHTATKECLGMDLVINGHHVFFMTPQILLNNIKNKHVSLRDITLLILDECHHTRKKEPYNNVMRHYLALKRQESEDERLPQMIREKPKIEIVFIFIKIVGLTATIGVGDSSTEEGAVQHMLRICANLDALEISRVDKNLEEFRKHVSVPKRETIKMGEKEKDPVKTLLCENISKIEEYIGSTEAVNNVHLKKMWSKKPPKKDGKQYQKWTVHFRNKVSCKLKGNDQLARILHAALTHLSAYNEALDVNYLMNKEHVAEHLNNKFEEDFISMDEMTSEERGFLQMIKEFSKKIPAVRSPLNPYLRLMRDKMVELKEEYDNMRGMVFVQTRATAFALAGYLTDDLKSLGIDASPFTGTNSSETSKGMPDTLKNETLQNFRDGRINVLVATSVGSEGIDVPDCNFIITYNYTGNEANVIQMSGRARKQGSTVAHISDQAIQKREEVSLQKARMMENAFDRLSSMLPVDRERKIKEYQNEVRIAGGLYSPASPEKIQRKFQLKCFKCHEFAVSNNHVRLYVGQHRVVTDPEFQKRCEYDDKTIKSTKYTLSVIKCSKCKLKWGTTFRIEGKEVPVLKVTAFLFEVFGVEEPKRFKKWGKVEYEIEPIEKAKLLNFFKAED